jgi:hypothetical protein
VSASEGRHTRFADAVSADGKQRDAQAHEGSELPFDPDERLVYKVKWGLFTVGTSTLEALPMGEVDGEPAYRFCMQVRTNGFADAFYKLRERMDTWLRTDFSQSLRYTKYAEGAEARDEVIDYHWPSGKIFSQRDGKPRDPLEVADRPIFDPLGALFAFRFADSFEPEPGSTLTMYSSDGKKVVQMDVEIKRRQTIRVPAGKFKTVKARPDTKNLGGVFKKSDDASIIIWYSDDERRIPVRLKSKVVVGSFVANLEEIETRSPETENLVNFPDPVRRQNWESWAFSPIKNGEKQETAAAPNEAVPAGRID